MNTNNMSNEASLFFPHRIDRWNPVESIHREVAFELRDRYHITGYYESECPDVLDRGIRIGRNSSRSLKLLKHLYAFSKKYDIVHTGPSRLSRFALLSSLRGAEVVHTFHSPLINKEGIHQRELASVDRASAVTAVSRYVRDDVKNTLDINKEISIIPNGVDLSLYNPSQSETENQICLFVGRLIERKNPEFIINLAREVPEKDFYIRGSGPLFDNLKVNQRELNNLHLVSKLPEYKLAELYSKASVLLCPFVNEGFGMVVLEALASDTPVIGLNSGNLPHLITKNSGLICEELDTSEWISSIYEIDKSPNQFSPREESRNYAWPVVAEQYQSLYSDLTQN